jgi:hypothetical protein
MKLSRASSYIVLAMLYMGASDTATAATPPQTSAEMEIELSASLAAGNDVNLRENPADFAFNSGWQDRRFAPFFFHNQICEAVILDGCRGQIFNPVIQGRNFVLIKPTRR